MMRSRWAAIGAAIAVTFGAGGMVSVWADTAASVFVAITPTRVLDSRNNVGLNGVFTTGTARKLDVTGNIPVVNADGTTGTRLVVPDGATAIVANLTAVSPTSRGFVAIRPGTATGTPSTSNINIPAPGVNIPNAVTVEIPTTGPQAGRVDLFFKAPTTGASTHLLLDIVGYYTEGTGTPGPQGPAGAPGATGPAGPQGEPGVDAESPDRVIWVADDGTGDFTTVAAALASITDASATKPYLIRIAPGVYQTTAPIVAKDHVDIEGSGKGITTIRCTTGCNAEDTSKPALDLSAEAEIRHLTVENRSPGTTATIGIVTTNTDAKALRDVAVLASGGRLVRGVYNDASSPAMTQVAVNLDNTGGDSVELVGIMNSDSSPDMTDIDVTATGCQADCNYSSKGISNSNSSPTMTDVDVYVYATAGAYGVLNNNSAPTMTDVRITAESFFPDTGLYFDQGNVYGIYNTGSLPVMTDIDVRTNTADGESQFSYGVLNDFSTPTITNLSVVVTAPNQIGLPVSTISYGVFNFASSPYLINVASTVTNGLEPVGTALLNRNGAAPSVNGLTANAAIGVHNLNGSPTIRNSVIYGATNSIVNDASADPSTAKIAETILEGLVSGSGFTCLDVHTSAFVSLSATCT